MNKVDRLVVAGAIAPFMRAAYDIAKRRRVHLENSNRQVVGHSTWAEVWQALLRRHQVEIEVQSGYRPKDAICRRCGRLNQCQRHASVICEACRSLCCADCGKRLPKSSGWRSVLVLRCKSCSRRARIAFAPGGLATALGDVACAEAVVPSPPCRVPPRPRVRCRLPARLDDVARLDPHRDSVPMWCQWVPSCARRGDGA